MSQTRAQRRKQQKVKARQKAIRKMHNIQRNAPEKRYRLDVLIGDEWKIGVRQWAYGHQVEAHRVDTEKRRQAGEEIVPGRVIDMKLGKVVLEIPGSKVKGMAPDKITDGAKASDFKVKVESPEPVAGESEVVAENAPEKKSLLSRVMGRDR